MKRLDSIAKFTKMPAQKLFPPRVKNENGLFLVSAISSS